MALIAVPGVLLARVEQTLPSQSRDAVGPVSEVLASVSGGSRHAGG